LLGNVERREAAPRFYSPKAVLRKEGEDLGGGFGRWRFGKRRDRRLEEGGAPDEWARSVSDGKRRGRRGAHELGQRPASWARPRRKTGRGEVGRARWVEAGPAGGSAGLG
jgi:hypothetical protein